MSYAELLLKEIEGLPANYIEELIDFAAYLKQKALLVQNEPAGSDWVNPLKGRARVLGSRLTYNRFMELQEADKKLEQRFEPRP
jgi:hypothetical protein